MISLYQLFKIIFGLIISVFILFLIIYFITTYTQVQEDSQKAEILRNFLKTAEDVYLTGNPVTFTDFSKQEFMLSIDETEPEGVLSSMGKIPISFPLLLKPGNELFIWKGELDMGWWTFRFTEALPRTRVIFNVISPEWETVREIIAFFPDSDFFTPKITFGFCDSGSFEEALCGGEDCEKQDFLFYINTPPSTMGACTAQIPENAVLITISPSCSPSQGVCLTPPFQGVGDLHISNHQEPLLYKDATDVIAAVIGGEKDIFGNSGATMYEYKNNLFRKELLLGAEIMKNRALLVGSNYPQESGCPALYVEFLNALDAVTSTLGDEDYYKYRATSTIMVNQLTQAFAAHQDLINSGCDYS